jgi:hypothetical protein
LPTKENLQAAVLKLENGKTFDPTVGSDTKNRVDDRDKVSSFLQEKTKVSEIDDQKCDETASNADGDNDLGIWLGVRDDFRNWLIWARCP